MSSLIFAAAILYSSVGHGGASGYLAAMAFGGLLPAEMKPAALVLNILVATIASIKFYKATCFPWSIFLAFAAASIPFAFLGGRLALPNSAYREIVGVVLLFSAVQLFLYTHRSNTVIVKSLPRFSAVHAL